MTARPLTRRPAHHFLDLAQIEHILSTAWNMAEDERRLLPHVDPPFQTYTNALRVEIAIFTGLRTSELHNLRPCDLLPHGLNIRRGKGSKPRVAHFLNGAHHSPTREVLRAWIEDGTGRPRRHNPGPEDPLWPSKAPAWHHWVVHRLGPLSGLQRKIEKLTGDAAHEGPPRYLVHPHLFRACAVFYARRYPRTFGGKPVPWDTIAENLGHHSADMTRTRYWHADEDDRLQILAESIPPHAVRAPPRPSFARQ